MKKGFDSKKIEKELENIWMKMGSNIFKGESIEELQKREEVLLKRLGRK